MGKDLSLSQRHRLKEKEAREVLEKAAANLGNIELTVFMKGIEVSRIDPQSEVFLADGTPVFVAAAGEVFPTLLNREVLDRLPTLTVDRGAVPHICNGADLMAPGIVKIVGEFQAGVIAVVVDEGFSKPIALVKTLYNSHEMSEKKQGKVARNFHYVGDKFWKTFKQMKNRVCVSEVSNSVNNYL